ncbi:MAG TPA: amidohydrolase family protein [Phycisphaerales bacterium]|nr:amidohydrolase family protein [Phycisphaerales bacterium]
MSAPGSLPDHIRRPDFALREAHAHLYQLGRSLRMIALDQCASPGDLLDRFAERAALRRSRDSSPLLGQAARPESWTPPRWPTLGEFDRVTGDTPALAWCFDYHALLANSAMLSLAGIDARTPDPPGGLIGRDGAHGLTGVVYERAAQLVWDAAPEPPPAARPGDLAEAVRSLGAFAEIHDLKSQPWLGPALRALLRRDHPSPVATTFVLYPLLADLDAVLASRAEWESDQVRLGGAKVFVDGTLNSRTAWMLGPYADGRRDHPRGTPMMSMREIEDAVRACDAVGLPLAAHAIGDAAVRAVLDAVARVRPRTPGFRIEHAEVIDGADVPRFAELGVIASVQPCHLLYDVEALRRALPHRLHRVLPLRDLIDAGCVPGATLLFGSDVPIVRPDPEDSILAATARRREGMDACDAVAPEQAISLDEAWRCFG